MPSAKTHSRGRSAIYDWRVKAGKREVFSAPKKQTCEIWIRDNQASYTADGHTKLRLIPPNV